MTRRPMLSVFLDFAEKATEGFEPSAKSIFWVKGSGCSSRSGLGGASILDGFCGGESVLGLFIFREL